MNAWLASARDLTTGLKKPRSTSASATAPGCSTGPKR